jgi:D-alanyl-lipoteichoic acid acyltransferase DltB (MBOAT superfamily)
LRQILPIFVHLGLLLAIFKVFRIETHAFLVLTTIALAALPIHYGLHFRWKKPFFVATSIFGLGWAIDPVVALYVVAFSAVFVGICYLPIRWSARATVLGAIAFGIVLLRPEQLAGVVPASVWPIIATMFMFRMVIYLYELKHAKKPEKLVDTLSYFFLLPNYCFIHFPVVDYRTLQRGHFAKDIHSIQRTGLQMMFRGTVHLLLYRLIYLRVWFPPTEVHNTATLVCYLVSNYLLYLAVSGQFHMACGMLHLFGFQLPETHHHYLFASSFTDYWRRINIYWKDFMVRIVFNPVVFRLKRRPQPVALAVATVAVFLATWLLHAYQWHLLKRTWGFSVPDALFWGVLGALVLVNVQLDARRARRPANRRGPATPGQLALRGVKIAGTFTTITLLWSLWSSPSVAAWVDMLRRGLGV